MKYKVKYKFWLKNGTYLESVVGYSSLQAAAEELKEHDEHIWEVMSKNRIGILGAGHLHIVTSEIVAYEYEDVSEPDLLVSDQELSELDEILARVWNEEDD